MYESEANLFSQENAKDLKWSKDIGQNFTYISDNPKT